jgi:hypothetical protein
VKATPLRDPDDGVEQRFAEHLVRNVTACIERAAHSLRRAFCAEMRGLPQGAAAAGAVGQGGAQRVVEHERAERRQLWIGAHEGAQFRGEGEAGTEGGFAQGRQRVIAGQRPSARLSRV